MGTFLYTPEKKQKTQFLKEFVVRTREFEELFSDIQSSKMKYPEQHYLLVGQRGSGKTTLLTRLKYAVEDDFKLKRWLIPLSFKEEQYYISELVNVWENIAQQLQHRIEYRTLPLEMARHAASADFEGRAFDILIRALEREKEKLVLFIDNIGDLLNKLNELEIRRLREILQTQPYIRLIAGSSVTLQDTTDYHQPLYEFFKVIHLDGLSHNETLVLLRKLAELQGKTELIERIIDETPSRIETLRNLSGGVPRTIVLLFQAFVNNQHGDSVNDLESILDAVTPLYKQRMDSLPAQQQKIVDAVARHWDAISVRELTEKLRIESKIISAQLRQLEKNQVIEKRITNTKNHLYLLRERFMNIWYLMRYGRDQDRQRVIWLVKFLETWCDPADIEKRVLDFAAKSKKATLDTQTEAFYAQVYSYFHAPHVHNEWKPSDYGPMHVAEPELQLSDEDFEMRIRRTRERQNWMGYLDEATRKTSYSDVQRTQVFDILNDESIDSFNLALQDELQKNLQYKFRDSNFTVPYFYRAYLFLYNVRHIYNRLTDTDEPGKKEFINYTANLYTSIIEKKEGGAIEEESFFQFIFALMVTRHYQTVVALFRETLHSEEIRNKHKLLYYTALYLAGGKKDEATERLDSTARKYVSDLTQSIEKAQKKLRISS